MVLVSVVTIEDKTAVSISNEQKCAPVMV